MLGTNKCRKSVFMKFNIVKLLSIFTIIKLSMSSKVLKIALDWTPNTNHAVYNLIKFFVRIKMNYN